MGSSLRWEAVAALLLCLAVAPSSTAKSTRFRMDKMNYVYDKALQSIHDKQRLLKLENDLSGFDRILLDNKEKISVGKITKEELATVDRKLRTLLEKYDLDRVLDAFEKVLRVKKHGPRPPRKRKKQEKRPSSGAGQPKQDMNDARASRGPRFSEKVYMQVVFGDERLQKLWSAAQTQKFAKDELEELHAELLELEGKHRVLDDALAALNADPHEENRVDGEHDSHLKMDEKNRRAKEASRAAHAHYDDLHRKVLNQEFSPFTSSKVKKLWESAQKSGNLTAYDLDVIREELMHFDKQLKKLDAHKEELARISNPTKKAESTLEHLENTELEAKHERLDRKLKKLEKYLVTKIKHSEL